MNHLHLAASIVLLALLALAPLACSSNQRAETPETRAGALASNSPGDAPPARVQAWMDRLSVAHEYDPQTGFIVAKEVVPLPPVIADGPRLDDAVRASRTPDTIVIAFATADRCAPCQQYKKDALNDPRVIARLDDPRFVPTHVEVDREPELASVYLGGSAIPMTYALRDGEQIAVLRGQRSPEELLAWLDDLARS